MLTAHAGLGQCLAAPHRARCGSDFVGRDQALSFWMRTAQTLVSGILGRGGRVSRIIFVRGSFAHPHIFEKTQATVVVGVSHEDISIIP